jgi:predicted ABC-type sugar transport system permease subunit
VCVYVGVCVTVIIPYSGLLKPFGGVLSLARSYCTNSKLINPLPGDKLSKEMACRCAVEPSHYYLGNRSF